MQPGQHQWQALRRQRAVQHPAPDAHAERDADHREADATAQPDAVVASFVDPVSVAFARTDGIAERDAVQFQPRRPDPVKTVQHCGQDAWSRDASLFCEGVKQVTGPVYAISAEQVGPGTTTIEFRGSDTLFGPALEAALREWGYAVVTDQATEGAAVTPLAYSIDPFEGGVLVRLSTLQVDLTRMYTLSATGATPASPLSVMQRGSEAAS